MLYTYRPPPRPLRLRYIAYLFCLTFTYLPSKADAPRAPFFSINLVGDDGLTQKLSYYLEKMAKGKKIPNLPENDVSGYVITSDENVRSDVLEGRAVVIYRVKLANNGKILGHKTGVCFEVKIEKCAKDIIHQFSSIMKINELRIQGTDKHEN